jgi:choline transport protein
MASHSDSAPMGPMKGSGANVSDEMDGDDYHNALRGTTRQDHVDMARMGKVPELQRNYRPLSALAFTVILQGTWEVLMT